MRRDDIGLTSTGESTIKSLHNVCRRFGIKRYKNNYLLKYAMKTNQKCKGFTVLSGTLLKGGQSVKWLLYTRKEAI